MQHTTKSALKNDYTSDFREFTILLVEILMIQNTTKSALKNDYTSDFQAPCRETWRFQRTFGSKFEFVPSLPLKMTIHLTFEDLRHAHPPNLTMCDIQLAACSMWRFSEFRKVLGLPFKMTVELTFEKIPCLSAPPPPQVWHKIGNVLDVEILKIQHPIWSTLRSFDMLVEMGRSPFWKIGSLEQDFAPYYSKGANCKRGCCSVLKYVAVCCRVLHCVAVCCSGLHCVAVCCSVLQCVV